ncbi:sirohydrochlorin chelatase [Nonomuraea sp. NBC_01738]|uniref:sirohydrochlorin chelatase n=1 Tax=Nonomuraea sp. NBC_01738 TaxID=2976003 RepID=UPI002E125159|nr:sirohydrochlorin chelatase [Nonomuraea sp. NBC_01738]
MLRHVRFPWGLRWTGHAGAGRARDAEPGGERTLERLTRLVRAQRPGHRVELAYLELSRPLLADLLPALRGPVTVVPLLLAAGYHVRTDLPRLLAAHPGVRLAGHLGSDALLTDALIRRLRARLGGPPGPGDTVLLGAAGSGDPSALAEVRQAARLLSAGLGREVLAAYASAGAPTVADALSGARGGRTVIASYLLAPGHFHGRLLAHGVPVTEPLGADPGVAALVWRRHDEAVPGRVPGSREMAGSAP